MHEPIAYTFEADYHCKDCTIERFGSTEGVDREGNQVGAVAPWDEWFDIGEGDQTLACGDCHEVIEQYTEV